MDDTPSPASLSDNDSSMCSDDLSVDFGATFGQAPE